MNFMCVLHIFVPIECFFQRSTGSTDDARIIDMEKEMVALREASRIATSRLPQEIQRVSIRPVALFLRVRV